MKKETNLNKKNKILFIVIALVIVIAIVCIVVSVTKNDTTQNNGLLTDEESANNQLDGQIDYSNDENVKVNDNVKENNSKALLKEKEFEGMEVKDIKLVATNGTTKFTATVENTSSVDFTNQKIVIVFKNKDGSEYARLNTYLGDIKVGATAQIDATTTSDVSNAYDFVIEKGV